MNWLKNILEVEFKPLFDSLRGGNRISQRFGVDNGRVTSLTLDDFDSPPAELSAQVKRVAVYHQNTYVAPD